MEVQPDFRDLLALLNEHKVEYLIVGDYALAFDSAEKPTALTEGGHRKCENASIPNL